ncbi:unnamed protein product [Diplocarpon coronariae]
MPIDRTSESTVQRSVGLDSEYPHTKTKRSWISSDCTQDSSRALAAADKLLNRTHANLESDGIQDRSRKTLGYDGWHTALSYEPLHHTAPHKSTVCYATRAFPDHFTSQLSACHRSVRGPIPNRQSFLKATPTAVVGMRCGLQLTLLCAGGQITFAGDIRVRTTTRSASQFASVRVVYKDRNGAAGSTVSTAASATASGFDKTFTAGQSPIWATKPQHPSLLSLTCPRDLEAPLQPMTTIAPGSQFKIRPLHWLLTFTWVQATGCTKSASSTGDSEPAGSLMPYTATPTQTARAFNATIGAEAYSGARPRRLDCELAPDFLLLKDGYGARDVRE